MSTPAERYAASRRQAHYRAVATYRASLPFELDDFQVQACEALEDGKGVLVAAPTGAGKTVVAEFGVDLALRAGRRAFYTTPIKALSNQKYREFTERFGRVGLLTGDVSIDPDAPVVVMTTEVLRNMLYAAAGQLDGVGLVVMDEVHYLADRFRGPVWEEVLIHLPQHVQVVSLSATVSNAEEFGQWLNLVRGDTAVVVSETRPVPLTQHVMVGARLFDLYAANGRLNPELLGAAKQQRHGRVPRSRIVAELDREGLLPAIYFIFSRQGCEDALAHLAASPVRLTSDDDARAIRNLVEYRTAGLDGADLATLGYHQWLESLTRGYAAHHAGMIPLFKEIVEELFAEGLLKVVFATETLALGINMPARSVVLERLDKWDGSAHVRLTAGEYTQLTGRAGRRGIDVEGHAVVLHSRDVHVEAVAGLAAKRTYPLRSAFRATYNMSVNLLAHMDRARAHESLQLSFAQFLLDRSVVSLAKEVRAAQSEAAQLAKGLTCSHGDLPEYLALRAAVGAQEKEVHRQRSQEAADARTALLESVRVGDVVELRGRERYGVVVDVVDHPRAGRILDVVTTAGKRHRIDAADLAGNAVLGHVKTTSARSPKARADMAARVRELVKKRPARPKAAPEDATLAQLRAELRAHPCHSCPHIEEHARRGRAYSKAQARAAQVTARISAATGGIAAGFDKLTAYLEELGYLKGDTLTDAGALLRRIYNECDLLTAEALRRGLWQDLNPAELAGAVSLVAAEARSAPAAARSTARLQRAMAATGNLWGELHRGELAHRIEPAREIDPRLAPVFYQWASGAGIDSLLGELLPGDFVRAARQVIDVLEQLAASPVLPEDFRARARRSRALVDRGIVALLPG